MKTRDLRVESIRPLLPPAILLEELPLSEDASQVITRARDEVAEILAGSDDRLIVIVGPCSVHDPAAAGEYARRLKTLSDELAADLRIVMRVYFEKPRTTVGWKGLINDPRLDGSFAINDGLRRARRLLLDLAELGLPAGCEFLDPISPQFTSDLVAWGAIGAVRAARHPHQFLGVTEQGLCAIVATRGNPDCHVILRGGASGSNYDAVSVQKTTAALVDAGLPPRLMIDTSHGNSDKDYRRQPVAGRDIAEQVAHGEAGIFGVMMESFLVDGRQELRDPAALRYGQSVTDACMGWEMTIPVLAELAQAVRSRRSTS